MSIKDRLRERIAPAVAGFLGIRTKIALQPISHLEEANGKWRAHGNDPAFLVSGRYFAGWNKIEWESESESVIPLKMYWDRGQGLSESESTVFSAIPRGAAKRSVTVYIPAGTRSLRIDPGEDEAEFVFKNVRFKKTTRLKIVLGSVWKLIAQKGFAHAETRQMIRKGIKVLRTSGAKAAWVKFKEYSGHQSNGIAGNYENWLFNHQLTHADFERIKQEIQGYTYQPLISIILPVYNVDEKWLRLCIDSVLNQLYTNWELCIADDASTKPHIKKVLNEYAQKDSRIKVVFRVKNGHISESSNSGLEVAAGEYVGLLDHDDELSVDALYENVKLLNEHPEADIVYSDEDKISEDGMRHSPYFKPDWSPDLLLSQMYTCHFSIYRRSLVEQVGGFRKGYEGSQDYDLVLRVSELTEAIYHIPKILYHWRTIEGSTALMDSSKSYTHISGLRAVEDALVRRNINGWVEGVQGMANLYHVHYRLQKEASISIVIPNKNLPDILDQCLTSIFEKTNYQNYEVLVVDNGSDNPATFDIYKKWERAQGERFRYVEYDIPFNYSKINNFGVEQTQAELILLLNNDVEVISPDWLTEMAGQAMRSEVGAVGACLYYPDDTIQHAGVVLGIGGVAGHSHKHFRRTDNGYFSRLKMISNYAAVTAACLMIRREVYLEVGGLEESLQVAFNDVDFCLKVWTAGYRNVWLPHVQLYHYESKSRGYEDTPEKQKRFKQEIDLMQEKWSSALKKDPYYNINLSKIKEDFSINIFD
ncbi:glycosyltransferase family 2 protein [Saccharibacillus deserti]|uniref:glycosyltransferase family 2 protein n=1 Tax=Saccharibacillus deserti TaxID=1634444 RepID=UPI001551F29C|nr:glycosyltransferase family 2 protein [Saccharibacillus deserti]